jgi:hypothetical protein
MMRPAPSTMKGAATVRFLPQETPYLPISSAADENSVAQHLANAERPGRMCPGPMAPRCRPTPPQVAKARSLLDDAETDVLAYMTFPPQHRTKLHSTNPIERLNGEIKRRTEVVGIFQ